jgi:hypothetical protein
MRTNDLKEGNIILVGAAEANPWVELYEPSMNFQWESSIIEPQKSPKTKV